MGKLYLANAGDFQFGEVTAIAFGLVVTLAALEFESDTLFAAELLDDLSGDCSTSYGRRAYCGGSAIVNKENLIKFCFGTNFGIDFLDV